MGPSATPTPAIIAHTAIAFGSSFSLNTFTMTARVAGIIIAPPTPMIARAMISCSEDCDSAAPNEARANTPSPRRSIRARPNRSPTPPIVKSKPPKTRMYAFTIHCSAEADAPRSRCSDGMATLRIVSSMVANRDSDRNYRKRPPAQPVNAGL